MVTDKLVFYHVPQQKTSMLRLLRCYCLENDVPRSPWRKWWMVV